MKSSLFSWLQLSRDRIKEGRLMKRAVRYLSGPILPKAMIQWRCMVAVYESRRVRRALAHWSSISMIRLLNTWRFVISDLMRKTFLIKGSDPVTL